MDRINLQITLLQDLKCKAPVTGSNTLTATTP